MVTVCVTVGVMGMVIGVLFTSLCFLTGRAHSRHADGHTPVRRAKAVPRDSLDEQLGENTSDHVKNVIRSSMQVRSEYG